MKTNILLITLFLTMFNSANASPGFFGNYDYLGPYPAAGSPEEKIDLVQMLELQNSRTKEQCEKANLERDSGLAVFFGGKGGPLTDSEITLYKSKLRALTVKTGVQIYLAKKQFKRSRPYLTHKEIKPCIQLESSDSYPSGHATLARVYARALALAFPERKAQIFKRGDEIAYNRVLGGVHYPSDIAAAKKLGDAIADDYFSTSDHLYKLQYETN